MKPKKPSRVWEWGWRWYCSARDGTIPESYGPAYRKRPAKPGPKRDGWDAAAALDASGGHATEDDAEAARSRAQ